MSTTADQTKINTAAKVEATQEPTTPRRGRAYVLKRAGAKEAKSALVPSGPVTRPSSLDPQAVPYQASTQASVMAAGSGVKADIIYLGMDVHADRQVVVVQVDATTPKPAQSMDIKALHVFAGKQLQQAHRVVACYEAGPCGYSLCRALIAMGIECMVVRPKCWDEFGSKVKTDARDARQLCEALERHTKGNTNALSVASPGSVTRWWAAARALPRKGAVPCSSMSTHSA